MRGDSRLRVSKKRVVVEACGRIGKKRCKRSATVQIVRRFLPDVLFNE